MATYYYFHDCETTGQTKEHSLLQYYACVCDQNLKVLYETKEFNIFDNNKPIKIDKEALKYNKINLGEHIENSISYREFLGQFNSFLLKHFSQTKHMIDQGQKIKPWSSRREKQENDTFIICGHNVAFDNMFIFEDINSLCKNNYIDISTKSPLDTSTIAQFLKLQGKLPSDIKISLENLAKHFNLSIDGMHSPKKDVQLTIEILKKFKETI